MFQTKVSDFYVQKNSEPYLLKENILFYSCNVFLSLAVLLVHYNLASIYTDVFFEPAFSLNSPDLMTFQKASLILGPVGWILSQLLLLLYYYVDNGAETCGLEFVFNNNEEKNLENSNKCEDDEDTATSSIEDALIDKLFKSSVTFKSVSGRWVDPEWSHEEVSTELD